MDVMSVVTARAMGSSQGALQHRMLSSENFRLVASTTRAGALEHGAAIRETADQVPLVDLAEVRRGDDQGGSKLQQLAWTGVINHGVSMEFVHKLRQQSLDVFSLPTEVKDKVSRRGGSMFGYDFRLDHGPMEVFQVHARDNRQLLTYAPALFPNSSEDFIALYDEANLVFRTLAMEILDILIESLGVDAKHFQAHKRDSQGVLRANFYHQSQSTEQVLGLIPHFDGSLFTILHQDVSGLEVLKNGHWIPIVPRNDSFCINVADILQVLTNGQYKSVQHRAVVPGTQARLSVAYFLTPAESVTLVPAPELVDSQHPPLYRPFTWAEYLEASKRKGRPYPSVLPFFERRQS